MTNESVLIGAPSSAGAFAPGQEKAPTLLREAGLIAYLTEAGLRIEDQGDLPGFRYRNDPSNPRARNSGAVARNARQVADAVAGVLSAGKNFIVLGGDCTNGAGAIAGATRDTSKRTGVIYFDMHADLNTPETVAAGALDWMGIAHLLGEPGCNAEFQYFEERSPVLENDQIVFLGWDYVGSNSNSERETIIRRRLKTVPLADVQFDPTKAARQAIAELGTVDRFVVHFDVDVIDFADCPLGENYRHGEGCTFDQAMKVVSALAADMKFAGITITELNPDHGEEDLATLKRFSKGLAAALTS